MRKYLVLIALAIFTVSAVAQSRLTSDSASTGEKQVQQATNAEGDSYIIRPEDTITISVWRQPDFSGTHPVRPDGRISMPLVGDVAAAGKTTGELSAEITAKLKTYVEEPRVTVSLTMISARKVFVLGEINKPGPVVMSPAMTVLEAIAAAGGPTAYANSKKMFVLRTENGKQSRMPFNYKDALKGKSADQNIALKPGDTIVVP